MDSSSSSKPQRVGNYFGTFLDAVKTGPGDSPATPHRTPEGASTSRVLSFLRQLPSGNEVDVVELQRNAGLHFSEFAQVLDGVAKAGLVEVVGSPGDERVRITPQGMEIVALES